MLTLLRHFRFGLHRLRRCRLGRCRVRDAGLRRNGRHSCDRGRITRHRGSGIETLRGASEGQTEPPQHRPESLRQLRSFEIGVGTVEFRRIAPIATPVMTWMWRKLSFRFRSSQIWKPYIFGRAASMITAAGIIRWIVRIASTPS
jgi:hypothetical protein